MRILLVEDDQTLAAATCAYLRLSPYVVDVVDSLKAARLQLSLDLHYSAVLLDLHLSDGDGLRLLPQIRTMADPPITIILTARDRISDRIQGLDAGADDYLVKPYDPQELLARLRAVERRRSGSAGAVVRMLDVEIDLNQQLVSKAGKPVALTASEWAILHVLASRPNWLHSKDALLNAIYGFDDCSDSNTVEVFISRLRTKLGREAILTQRGLGYRLNADKSQR